MRRPIDTQLLSLCLALVFCNPVASAPKPKVIPAEYIFRNGVVYTVDLKDSVAQALAVRAGRIIYVGPDVGANSFIGPQTQIIDMRGRMLMPGLVDGHLHPLDGGEISGSCNLDYQPLTVQGLLQRIQACLDADKRAEPGDWLKVTSWYRQFMQPAGTEVTRQTLDGLRTQRPVLLESTDGHSTVANTRALSLAKITAKSVNPEDGQIVRDGAGQPTGVFEDGAAHLLHALIAPPSEAMNLQRAQAALDAMRRQGITTFLDAAAADADLVSFAALAAQGRLTARAHFAPVIDVKEAVHTASVVARLQSLIKRYDQTQNSPKPVITVHNAKLFMDGVIQWPAQTAGLLQPYWVEDGSGTGARYSPGTQRGEVYFPSDVLGALLAALGRAGIEPHIHAVGDRSVRQALDAVAFMRDQMLDPTIRVSIAHCELVDPADLHRFATLDVTPVMSFQWAKRGPDSIDAAQRYLGADRFAHLEPESSLYAARARVAFGSDWPVDRLDEWFAMKVSITRSGDPSLGAAYAGRFNDESGLPLSAAIRAMTFNAAYELHQDHQLGSLEPGKLADLILIDRNLLNIAADDIANVRVLLTMVGGSIVYRTDGP